ncbi:hypothetical protein EXIGLDRAFT_69764 [Exidia glandulosa HHB12029]|uniref:Uncharacterized protein n=1 Tax=Exidia glandulosa HHB12029 TaxID=1314781 RepID=A0A165HZ51_EXIGL|nr:hypothetical protein EXIGLDRAFT_69764 [Exidia glandulosa HHB12029]
MAISCTISLLVTALFDHGASFEARLCYDDPDSLDWYFPLVIASNRRRYKQALSEANILRGHYPEYDAWLDDLLGYMERTEVLHSSPQTRFPWAGAFARYQLGILGRHVDQSFIHLPSLRTLGLSGEAESPVYVAPRRLRSSVATPSSDSTA